ncbi:hypothetical protein BOTBODRAFT_433676 [Botryobasidium botryosum FD-172 SS1]|uniref:Uncharacterized protein n=1 Tax=Botryobasidium botryosum (strain FD-172 SS1) TaxID=930990 RepID=A0A067MX37_BOTB1|nr:hypothetical protein BOTBODRAFT_433676 [Botryobasidium botryosum FD-172 SS1]
METQPRSPEATPKNAALVAWLDRLDNVARSIQLYATEVTALCGDYDGAQGHGAVTPHVDVFFEIYSRMDEMHFMEARLAACALHWIRRQIELEKILTTCSSSNVQAALLCKTLEIDPPYSSLSVASPSSASPESSS